MGNELLVIEESKALAIFTSGNIDPLIEAAKQIVDGFEHDLSTGVGRAKTAKLAAKISKYKVKLDEMRKGLVSEWKEKAKKVDQSGKILRDQLDDLRDLARQPLSNWENTEKERVEKHKEFIERLTFDHDLLDQEVSEIDYLRDQLVRFEKSVVCSDMEEFELEASKAKASSIEVLNSLIQKEEFRIKQEQELVQLKKEKDERDQKDRDDRLKREAAEKATREAEARNQAELEKSERTRQLAIDQKNESESLVKESERKRIQSEEKAKIDAANAVENARIAQANADQEKKDAIAQAKQEEIQRQVKKIASEKKERAIREADREHKGQIMGESKKCLMSIVDEITAKKIVLAITNGKINHVTINF